jgi:hypothetical protein
MQRRQPQSYEDWLSEIKFSNSLDAALDGPGIIPAAMQAARMNPDKKAARHDVALVLADKYRGEIQRAGGRPMLIKVIDDKFDKIGQIIFKSKFSSIYKYVLENEPNFDPKATNLAKGGAALGFIKRPDRVNDNGVVEKGLGFLNDDNVGGGALGFL